MELKRVGRTAADKYINDVGAECINLKGFLQANSGVKIYSDDKLSGIITEKRGMVQIHSRSDDFIDAARAFFSDKIYFYSDLEKHVGERLLNGRKTNWNSFCHILWYPHASAPEVPVPDNCTVGNIDLKWADLVNDNYTYKDEYSKKRIISEISLRPSSAVYIDGKPVAWTLLHSDYSMGAMFVLPDYRREGLAYVCAADLMKKVIAEGMTPYVQIIYDNYASIGLAKKLGFEKIFEAYWFEI